MRIFRALCPLLILCLLAACGRKAGEASQLPVSVTYTPDPTAVPTELLEAMAAVASPVPDDPRASALLYEGERVSLYGGYRNGQPGICVKELWFGEEVTWYQELPGTESLLELNIANIVAQSEGEQAEARVDVHFLDESEKEWVLRIDLANPNGAMPYLLSAEPSGEMTEETRAVFEDLLLTGYVYETFQQDKAGLSNPEDWESLCQTRILDALYYFHEDSLPPYLVGEGVYDDEYDDTAILSQAELDAFFHSVLNRPNQVRDRVHWDEDDWPNLLPGQVPLPPTDYSGWATVKQAISKQDGSMCLYGRAGWGEDSCIVLCHIRPAKGFLGYCIENTEIYRSRNIANDPLVTFVP